MPIRASPAAHGELRVPGQPCSTPPMVPRGPSGGVLMGSRQIWGCQNLVGGQGWSRHTSSIPSPHFSPKTSTARHHPEQSPLRLQLPAPSASGSAGRTGGRGVTLGPEDICTPRLPQHQHQSPKLAGASPGSVGVRFPPASGTTPTEGEKPGAPERPGWQGTVPQLTQPQTPPQGSVTPGGPFARCRGAGNPSGTPCNHQPQASAR